MADVTLTLAEAAQILEPAMTEKQLRAIITALRWPPDGHRYTGRQGHPAATYNATRLMQLHAAVAPFIGNSATLNSVRQHCPETGETPWPS